MGLIKAIIKGLGTKANDAHTQSEIDKSGDRAYKQTKKELKKATKKGVYLGKRRSREIYFTNKDKNQKKAESKGKVRDRFLDGL